MAHPVLVFRRSVLLDKATVKGVWLKGLNFTLLLQNLLMQ